MGATPLGARCVVCCANCYRGNAGQPAAAVGRVLPGGAAVPHGEIPSLAKLAWLHRFPGKEHVARVEAEDAS